MLGAIAPPDPVLIPDRFCDSDFIPQPTTAPLTTQPAGLGDVVSSALSAIGITEERVQAWLGGECGCAARRAKLNRLGAWASSFLTGTPTEPIESMIQEEV
jgi:hypothetical protein